MNLYMAGGCFVGLIFLIMFISAAVSEQTGLMIFSLFGVFVSAGIGLVLDNNRKLNFSNSLAGLLDGELNKLQGFNATQKFISEDRETLLAIDENKQTVCIIENENKNTMELSETFNKYKYKTYIYSYNDVLQSEIIQDGKTITQTSRGSQIGGALIGGLVAGGVGAIIGGLSGRQSISEEIKRLDLQLVVNNSQKPIFKICFALFETPQPSSGVIVKNAMNRVKHWHTVLGVVIKQADQNDKNGVESPVIIENTMEVSSKGSVADEIRNLHQLVQEGLLTPEEFTREKAKLLG